MARQRISTTVDSELLERARALDPASADAQLFDCALNALLDSVRRAEIDEAYLRAYGEHPLDEPDAWGDLARFGAAVRET
jgi:hypothetical protein